MDDIVTRIRKECGCQFIPWNEVPCLPCRAADEIERLRAALRIAAGKLSTLEPFTDWHPKVIYKALLEDGATEADRG